MQSETGSVLGVLDCLFVQSQTPADVAVSQSLSSVRSIIDLEAPTAVNCMPFPLANHPRGTVYGFNGTPPEEGCQQSLTSARVERRHCSLYCRARTRVTDAILFIQPATPS